MIANDDLAYKTSRHSPVLGKIIKIKVLNIFDSFLFCS